jgi:[histone H3]-N6,N6-dimethyl-L-lysine4 FAD-dependent demethylase
LPVGVLKERTVNFFPPLPDWKVHVIDRFGFGVVNRVALIFPRMFWANSTIIGTPGKTPFIFVNLYKIIKQTVLLAVFSGESAAQLEKSSDKQIQTDIMEFLRKVSTAFLTSFLI